MSDLVYRQPCQHGKMYRHLPAVTEFCPGGSEIVLDPDKVLENVRVRQDVSTIADIKIADVLAALEGLYDELADLLEVAIARGEQLGYADDDYRHRLAQARPLEETQ